MKTLIKKLTESFGPSGNEQNIRSCIINEIQPLADEITTTRLGSLIAVKRSNLPGEHKKIMVAAHMDEIGFMVTHIDQNGFLRFLIIGTINLYTLTGQRCIFENGMIGVISLEKLPDKSKTPTVEQFYIDIGNNSRESSPIKIGDVAVFYREFHDLGNRMVAKAFDDRIGCVLLIEAMRTLPKIIHDIYFVFTVQEEIKGVGARTAAYHIDPDVGIAVDVTDTGDTPESAKLPVALGNGPTIMLQESHMISHKKIKDLMIQRATEHSIPFQLEVQPHGTTDAASIQLSRGGVACGTLSIPCRYIHTPSELIDYKDAVGGIHLLQAFLSNPIDL